MQHLTYQKMGKPNCQTQVPLLLQDLWMVRLKSSLPLGLLALWSYLRLNGHLEKTLQAVLLFSTISFKYFLVLRL